MPTVLITGVSRGIGGEFAAQYAADGWRVIATCRDPAQYGGDGEAHALDVTDAASVAALGLTMAGEKIDLLINNAGIYGPRNLPFDGLDYEAWDRVLRINLMGPMRVAAALAGPVMASQQKKMIFISSKVGSIAENSSGGSYLYRSSKTALNMAVKSLSLDLAGKGAICLLLHPGWVQTDMGGVTAPVDRTASVAGLRTVIDRASTADNGRFFNYDGTELPW